MSAKIIKLTNISGGQLVCDLATEGKTLRLDNKKATTIQDKEITYHIKRLISKGLLKSEEVSYEAPSKSVSKNSNKEKEE